MRAITLLAAIGTLSVFAVAAQADDESLSDACAAAQAGVGQVLDADGSQLDLALCASEGSTNLTTVTTGQVGGEPVSLTTVEVGNVTITTGQAGGKSVNTTTVKIGNVEHKIELPGN